MIDYILGDKRHNLPQGLSMATAHTNIALVKYWGKRDETLNLPVTSSLSVTLPGLGTQTKITAIKENFDAIELNNVVLDFEHEMYRRIISFLDLIRPTPEIHYAIQTENNIPTAAGLASSASGFAALVKALNGLHRWELTATQQSLLARLGSGSACRSLWNGFVECHAGKRDDGMDSFAEPLDKPWPQLCVGLVILQTTFKRTSSREAMIRTVHSSPLYKNWPKQVERDLASVKTAIYHRDFELLGNTAEANSEAMHATMKTALPPVNYDIDATIDTKEKVRQLRQDGVEVYFTQDAGPNVKLLFLADDEDEVKEIFPGINVIVPFAS